MSSSHSFFVVTKVVSSPLSPLFGAGVSRSDLRKTYLGVVQVSEDLSRSINELGTFCLCYIQVPYCKVVYISHMFVLFNFHG